MIVADSNVRVFDPLAIAGVAALGGLLVGLAIWKFEPFPDPVGVVGLPVVLGYSERSEFLGLVGMVATTSAIATWLSARSQDSCSLVRRAADDRPVAIEVAATLTLLTLISFTAWHRCGVCSVAASGIGLLAFWLAKTRSVQAESSQRLKPVLFTAVLFCFPESAISFQNSSTAAAVFLALAISVVSVHVLSRAPYSTSAWIVAEFVCLGLILVGRPDRWVQSSAAAIAVYMGAWTFARNAAGRVPQTCQDHSGLFAATLIGLAAYFDSGWLTSNAPFAIRHAIGGASTGALLVLSLPAMASFDPNRQLHRGRQLIPSMVAISFGLLAIYGPWTACIVLAVALSWAILPKTVAWRSSIAGIASLFLFLPELGTGRTLDAFHDGQILSAVWEFQSGRTLFDQVFPLRSFEFFLTWVVQCCFAKSPAAYLIAEPLTSLLVPAGMFANVFAWTRRPAWSFCAAMATAWLPSLDGRMAMHLWLAAFGILAMRKGKSPVWLVVPGCIAGFSGFDFLGPFVAAIFVGSLAVDKRFNFWRSAIANGMRSLLWTAGGFSLAIIVWQGAASLLWHWRLFFDFAGNYTAFFGRPLPWHVAGASTVFIVAIMSLTAWTAWGGAVFSDGDRKRTRAWIFVSVQSLLIFQRGFGRSDIAHLRAMTYPAALILALGLYEILQRSTANSASAGKLQFRGATIAGFEVAAFVVATILVCETHRGEITPARLFDEIQQIVNRANAWPTPTPAIATRCTANDTLWEMENGLQNFLNRRHNPTRHALAYCIGTPNEQRIAAAAIAANRPAVIVWDFQSGTDGIPNPFRYWRIMPTIYRDYWPIAGTSLLERKPSPNAFPTRLDHAFTGPIGMGKLPLNWGIRGFPKWDESSRKSLTLATDMTTRLNDHSSIGIRENLPTSPFDFLILNAKLTTPIVDTKIDRDADESLSQPNILLEFGTGVEPDSRATIQFAARGDSSSATYVLPVRCSPTWSWNRELKSLRFVPPDGRHFVDAKLSLVRPESD